MHAIQAGWTKAMALVRLLGQYYIQHREPDNEILLRVAGWIQQYCAALEDLIRSNPPETDHLEEISRVLRAVDQEEVQVFGEFSLRVSGLSQSGDVEARRKVLLSFVMKRLNLHADLARKLLRARRMATTGALGGELDRLLDEPPENLF